MCPADLPTTTAPASARATAPLVSVIMPVLNGEDYLDQSIGSVMGQSLQRLELLVIDDGSQDASLEVVRTWARRYPDRISYSTHLDGTPHGIVRGYRDGAAMARGQYLAFLEQDDRWSEDFLENKVRVFKNDTKHEIGVVFCPYRVVLNGWFGLDLVLRQWLLAVEIPNNKPFDNSRALLRYNNVACFSAFTCRQELWAEVPVPSDVSTPYFDWWALAHLSRRALFFREDESRVYWRCSRRTALGSQSYESHKEKLGRFLPALFDSLSDAELPGEPVKSESLRRQSRALPPMLDLLKNAGVRTLARAFRANPNWALRMLASMTINRMKKS